MFNWDIYTHEKEHLYMQELYLLEKKDRKEFNQQNDSAWKAWMQAQNQWISFYEWYYPSINQVEDSLIKQFRNEAKKKSIKLRDIYRIKNSKKIMLLFLLLCNFQFFLQKFILCSPNPIFQNH